MGLTVILALILIELLLYEDRADSDSSVDFLVRTSDGISGSTSLKFRFIEH